MADEKKVPDEKPAELSDDQVERVAGGGASMTDFHFTRVLDKSSPTLFETSAPSPAPAPAPK